MEKYNLELTNDELKKILTSLVKVQVDNFVVDEELANIIGKISEMVIRNHK
jgi:hypothetical protein